MPFCAVKITLIILLFNVNYSCLHLPHTWHTFPYKVSFSHTTRRLTDNSHLLNNFQRTISWVFSSKCTVKENLVTYKNHMDGTFPCCNISTRTDDSPYYLVISTDTDDTTTNYNKNEPLNRNIFSVVRKFIVIGWKIFLVSQGN